MSFEDSHARMHSRSPANVVTGLEDTRGFHSGARCHESMSFEGSRRCRSRTVTRGCPSRSQEDVVRGQSSENVIRGHARMSCGGHAKMLLGDSGTVIRGQSVREASVRILASSSLHARMDTNDSCVKMWATVLNVFRCELKVCYKK